MIGTPRRPGDRHRRRACLALDGSLTIGPSPRPGLSFSVSTRDLFHQYSRECARAAGLRDRRVLAMPASTPDSQARPDAGILTAIEFVDSPRPGGTNLLESGEPSYDRCAFVVSSAPAGRERAQGVAALRFATRRGILWSGGADRRSLQQRSWRAQLGWCSGRTSCSTRGAVEHPPRPAGGDRRDVRNAARAAKFTNAICGCRGYDTPMAPAAAGFRRDRHASRRARAGARPASSPATRLGADPLRTRRLRRPAASAGRRTVISVTHRGVHRPCHQ